MSLSISLCLCLCFIAGVQNASSQTTVPVAAVSMKLDFVAWGDSIQGLRIKVGSKEIPISAVAFEYSTPVSYAGSDILEISQARGSVDASPYLPSPGAAPAKPDDSKKTPSELELRRKENPDLVALAVLPAGSRRATILIAPGADGSFQSYVIDDDPTRLPFGKLRIHNYCSFPIAMRCNGKVSFELPPKQTTSISPVDSGVVYELAYRKDEKWKMQENNVVRVDDSEQVQMVVLKSEANYFTSGDGSRGGFLQTIVLRRSKKQETNATTTQK